MITLNFLIMDYTKINEAYIQRNSLGGESSTVTRLSKGVTLHFGEVDNFPGTDARFSVLVRDAGR